MKTKWMVAMLAGALGLGYVVSWWVHRPTSAPTTGVEEVGETEWWTCSMHPQIKLPKPGKCPICAMDLIPFRPGRADDVGPRQLRIGEAARRLAEVEVAPVERRFPEAKVRLVGKVEYDETRLAQITAWVPGRLDRLYVDYTGVPVRKGDHMVLLYSPALLTAQEELLQALKTVRALEQSPDTLIRQRAQETIESARRKLELWGLTPEQVSAIEKGGETSDHLTIYAPESGIVVHKDAQEGMYVSTGTRIYTIADLSHLWVKLDAYESDLPWIHYGQEVVFATEAYPGESFRGRISFIDPMLNPQTRTVKVRVNVENADGRLKPEMFVRAVVQSRVASRGRVIDPSLAGKWISPMHPEIVKDGPGSCDICGMDLVPAVELGFVSADEAGEEPPLVIPVSAPLITGQRALVYVALTNQPGLYEGREVVLGPRAGSSYVVTSGLNEGELVVVRGNFKIDSAIELRAGLSMMHPGEDEDHAGHNHAGGHVGEPPIHYAVGAVFRAQVGDLFRAYLAVQRVLAGDDAAGVPASLQDLTQSLQAVDMTLLEGEAHDAWMKAADALGVALEGMRQGGDMESRRTSFEEISNDLWVVLQQFGFSGAGTAYRVHCPMAFKNRGADWIQDSEQVLNPYFGSRMLRCGEVREALAPEGDGVTEEKGLERP